MYLQVPGTSSFFRLALFVDLLQQTMMSALQSMFTSLPTCSWMHHSTRCIAEWKRNGSVRLFLCFYWGISIFLRKISFTDWGFALPPVDFMTWPTNQPNMDGLVEVSFKIDAAGIIQIVHIDSTSPQLTEYVVNKLGKIKLTNETKSDGRVITYRFMFKKQA